MFFDCFCVFQMLGPSLRDKEWDYKITINSNSNYNIAIIKIL